MLLAVELIDDGLWSHTVTAFVSYCDGIFSYILRMMQRAQEKLAHIGVTLI
jgi:hypothetical protein